MKNLLNFCVCALALSVSCACNACPSSAKKAGTIQDSKKAEQFFSDELAFTASPITLKNEMLHNKGKITVVDVRAKKDYEAGHIEGAVNVPGDDYGWFQDPLMVKEIAGLRKDGFNFIYCYDAFCNLGTLAAEKLARLGYPIKEVKGGFDVLKEKGLPIVKGK